MRKTICIILLAILVVQPVVLVSTMTIGSYVADVEIQNESIITQEPGSRIEEGDLTNHVPILINESAEFVNQGWPGSGTQGDPYVISGLRIHFNIGVPLIAIYNADDYFIIRDCYVMQNSTARALEFINTTHGMIEYSEIYSVWDDSIFCFNANNTVIDHVISEGYNIGYYPTKILESQNVQVTNSLIRNLNYFGISVQRSHNFHSSDNQYSSSFKGVHLDLEDSNNATSISDTVGPVGVGVSLDNSNASSVTGLVGTVDYGFSIYDCHDLVIHNADLVVAYRTLYMEDSVGVNVTDSVFDGGTDYFVEAYRCNSSFISSNDFLDNDESAIYLEDCRWSFIMDNTFTDIGLSGITMDNCHVNRIEGNDLLGTGADGIQLSYCNNTAIDSNRVDNPDGFPIWAVHTYHGEITNNSLTNRSSHAGVAFEYFCGDWLVADNIFDILHGGVFAADCFNIDVYRNSFSNMFSWNNYAVGFNGCPDSEIINNTADSISAWGINLAEGSDRCHVEGNTMNDVGTGASITADNVTIFNNDFLNSDLYGIWINEESDNLDINSNYFENTDLYGIISMNASHSTIRNNVFDGGEIGIYGTMRNGTIENNNFTDCGIYLPYSLPLPYYYHTISGNEVNGNPFYYATNANGGIIDGNQYGQVMLVNSTNMNVNGGEFINCTSSVMLYYCDEVDIADTFSQYNKYSMVIFESTNVTVTDSIVTGTPDVSNAFGILFRNCQDVFVQNVTFVDMYQSGLRIDSTDDFGVRECYFTDVEVNGIYMQNSQYGTIELCEFTNVAGGIYFWGGEDILVTNSEFHWCNYGVFAQAGAQNNNITYNTISNGLVGIHVSGCNGWVIVGNEVLWNSWYGMRIQSGVSGNISLNVLINSGLNGFDGTSGTTYWDDNVNTGNYWSDYSGAPYAIPGASTSEDRYPMSALDAVTGPIISSPEDFSYAEFSEDNLVTWFVFDDYMRDWEVYIDDVLVEADAWDFANISVNIDGLGYGVHEIFVNARDYDNNYINDTVLVTVFDDTGPTISSPHNLIVFSGTSGNEIIWNVFDQNPSDYEILLDGVLWEGGTWYSGYITADVDSLDAGEHILTLILYDVDDNMISDEVTVYMLVDDLAPTIDHPDDVNITEGTTGNFIHWSATDAFPSHYQVTENNTVFDEGDWGGTAVLLDIDGLDSGHYTFVITVYDASGNSATDSVNVTVIPVEGWPPITPPDYTMLIAAALGAAGVAAVVVLIILRKRKQSAA